MPRIRCPYCHHGMSIKAPKPGRYKPRCSSCQEPFWLQIAEDGTEPIALRLDAGSAPAAKRRSPSESKEPPDDTPARESKAKRPKSTHQRPSQRTKVDDEPNGGTVPASPEVHFDDTLAADKPDHKPSAIRPDAHLQETVDAALPAGPVPNGRSPKTQVGLGDHGADGGSPDSRPRGVATAHAGAADTVQDPQAAAAHAQAHEMNRDSPGVQRLGGYRLLNVLGRGAMGTVYLAKQIALDRDVAIKTVQGRWANDPRLIARFMREAYSAAQLTHHNVVQVYDLGIDQNIHYFSMEYIRGRDLKEYLEKHGPVDPKVACIMILQAARGLSYAHKLGMIHRDIKPSNLMLSKDGIVKVTDLGLVKIPGIDDASSDNGADADESLARRGSNFGDADLTRADTAVGTPAYIAPEQANSSNKIDARADIYSLGCTLYALLAGNPPFSGKTAVEVISKHKSEPMIPLKKVSTVEIPEELSDIVERMTAKRPADRYQSLDETINDLRRFVKSCRAPREPVQPKVDAAQIAATADAYRNVPTARIKQMSFLGFAGGSLLFGLVASFLWLGLGTGFWIGLAASIATYVILLALLERNGIASRGRAWIATFRISDWVTLAVGALLLLAVGILLGGLLWWILFGILGAGVGAGMYFVFDRRIKNERAESAALLRKLTYQMREEGDDELEVRTEFAKRCGRNWEPAFEELFDYDAKLEMRARLKEIGELDRPKHAAWLDPILGWMDRRVSASKLAADLESLQSIERQGLIAEGMNQKQAAEEAQKRASQAVDEAMEIRIASPAPIAPESEQSQTRATRQEAAELKRARIKAMLAEAQSGKYSKKVTAASCLGSMLAFAIDGKLRFVLGALLVTGCLLWVHQNGLVSEERLKESGEQLKEAATQAIENREIDMDDVGGAVEDAVDSETLAQMQPLEFPVLGDFFDSFNPGIAGLLLLFTAFFRGWKMTVFAIPAAAVMVLGPSLGIPDLVEIEGLHLLSAVIGGAIGFVGILFGREAGE